VIRVSPFSAEAFWDDLQLCMDGTSKNAITAIIINEGKLLIFIRI
jgi:hypothetical protein